MTAKNPFIIIETNRGAASENKQAPLQLIRYLQILKPQIQWSFQTSHHLLK
jgi:hypothetical protein